MLTDACAVTAKCRKIAKYRVGKLRSTGKKIRKFGVGKLRNNDHNTNVPMITTSHFLSS